MTADLQNRLFRLIKRPVGEATRDDFAFAVEPVARPGDGELLVKNLFLSLDPAMRGWMNEARSYIAPVGLGEVMRAGGIGTVVESKHPKFQEGDTVSGMLNVQDYAVSDGKGMVKVDAKLAPLTAYLNVLGMPGMTAYFGLLESGQPRAGETVVVSGASGAVGATVGRSTARCDEGGYYFSYDQTYPYREGEWEHGRSGRYDYDHYSRRGCRLAVAPAHWGDGDEYRYVRVCPDERGHYRITD